VGVNAPAAAEEDEAGAVVPGIPEDELKPTSLRANGKEIRAGAALVAREPDTVVPLDDVDANEKLKEHWPAVEDAAVAVETPALLDELPLKNG